MGSVTRYLELLFLLHRLADLGEDQGALAEKVRDAMDEPERQLSAAQLQQVRRVSTLLNQERDRQGLLHPVGWDPGGHAVLDVDQAAAEKIMAEGGPAAEAGEILPPKGKRGRAGGEG